MFKRILVGIDGTKESERSVPWVRLIQNGAEVVLVRFLEPGPNAPEVTAAYAIGEPIHEPTIDEITAEAEFGLRRLAGEFEPRARTLVRLGMGFPGLLNAAAEVDADLISITTHGGSKAARRVFGGTTEKLMKAANIPVLVVPPHDDVVRSDHLRRIVVPVDGSEISEKILPLAERLAGRMDAELILAHAIAAPDEQGHQFAEMDRRLGEVAATLALRWIRARAVVRYGTVPGAIAEIARDEKADMIVMSAHGYGAVGRMIFGSVASEFIQRAAWPVMVARHEVLKALEAYAASVH